MPKLRRFGSPWPQEAIAWVLASAALALLVRWISTGTTAGLDQGLLQWLQQAKSPWLDTVAHVLSLLGSEAIGVVHIILLVVLVRSGRWDLALGLFIATGGAGLLNGLVKDYFDRPRPAEVYGLLPATGGQIYSFPSGHAMVSAAFFYFLAYVSCPFLTGWRRTGSIALLLLIAIVVGLARTYLGAHWPTDVIAGYLVGYVWAQTVIFAAHLAAHYAVRRRTPGMAGN